MHDANQTEFFFYNCNVECFEVMSVSFSDLTASRLCHLSASFAASTNVLWQLYDYVNKFYCMHVCMHGCYTSDTGAHSWGIQLSKQKA